MAGTSAASERLARETGSRSEADLDPELEEQFDLLRHPLQEAENPLSRRARAVVLRAGLAVAIFVVAAAAAQHFARARLSADVSEGVVSMDDDATTCAAPFKDNCATSGMPCCDEYTTCFEKSEGFGLCRPTCAKGAPDAAPPWDVEADGKPWTCRIIGGAGDEAAGPTTPALAAPAMPGIPMAPAVPAMPVAPPPPALPTLPSPGLPGALPAPMPVALPMALPMALPAPLPAGLPPALPAVPGPAIVEATPTAAAKAEGEATKADGPTLYCFAVALVRGNEPELLRRQLATKTGVFGCDTWSLFSEREMVLGAGPGGEITTTAIGGPMSTVKENTKDFLRAYRKLLEAGHHKEHDWTIKVDPDTVLFVDRLREKLSSKDIAPASQSLYYRNCAKLKSVQGPLEVFTQAAAVKFLTSLETCEADKDVNQKGEDWFFGHCMESIGVKGIADYGLLDDDYCTGHSPKKPCSKDRAAFHPFKTTEGYALCIENAKGTPKNSSSTV